MAIYKGSEKSSLETALNNYLKKNGVKKGLRSYLAEKTGYSNYYLPDLLNGKAEVTYRHIVTFVVALNMSVRDAIDFTGELGYSSLIKNSCKDYNYYYEIIMDVNLRENLFSANEYLAKHSCKLLGGAGI